jgi:hypothetical protein
VKQLWLRPGQKLDVGLHERSLYGRLHHAASLASHDHVHQVMYLGHEDLANAAKLEKGARSGCIAHMAGYAGQGGCRRRKVLAYFGERRWVGVEAVWGGHAEHHICLCKVMGLLAPGWSMFV